MDQEAAILHGPCEQSTVIIAESQPDDDVAGHALLHPIRATKIKVREAAKPLIM